MKREDVFVLFVIALVVALRRKIEWGTGWVWPVPSMRLGGRLYPAVISQEAHAGHNGVDIDYARRSGDGTEREYPSGTAGGTPGHFTPVGVPVLAAKDGRVRSCDLGPRGWEIVIDHGKPFATYYLHLSSTVIGPVKGYRSTLTGQAVTVKAGQPIGVIGGDPLEATHFRHLHFEVWHEGGADHAVSPDDAMETWPRVPWAFVPGGKT